MQTVRGSYEKLVRKAKRTRLLRRSKSLARRPDIFLATVAILATPLILLADQEGALWSSSYQAERSAGLDPKGRYAKALARFGVSPDLFGSIDAELALASDGERLKKIVSSLIENREQTDFVQRQQLIRSLELEVEALSDGESLKFIARSPAEPDARALVDMAAESFAEQRNAAAAGWLRESHARRSSEMASPLPAGDLLNASIRRLIDKHTATSVKLEALSLDAVSFEDLVEIDGSARALELLLERAVLTASLTDADEGDIDAAALAAEKQRLDQELERELQQLIVSLEDRITKLQADAYLWPSNPTAPDETAPYRAADAGPAGSPTADVIELLETTGPYIVTESETRVLDNAAINVHIVLAILFISMIGAAAALAVARRSLPWAKRRRRRPVIASRQDIYSDPAWPLGNVHKSSPDDHHPDRSNSLRQLAINPTVI